MGPDIRARNNVRILGRKDGPTVLFGHGFGCDQGMWQRVLPRFIDDYRVVLFDYVGSGNSDLDAYDPARYSSLDGYVEDVLEICAELGGGPLTFVGHSVSAMVAVAAAAKNPSYFESIILLAPSPSYLDYPGDGYQGGFSQADLDELLVALDSNYFVWANSMAPMIMGNPSQPELHSELAGSFCRVNPTVARDFARVAFLSDVRHLLADVKVPALILQASNDALVPPHVGTYLLERLPEGTLRVMKAEGHLPHVSAPAETADLILDYLRQPA